MALKFSNVIVSFLIFVILVTLMLNIYGGLTQYYGVQPTDLDQDGKSIMTKLSEIQILQGIKTTTEGLFSVFNPSSTFDLIGGALLVGAGVLKIAGGVIVFPIDIIGVVSEFYAIPPIITEVLGLIFIIYIGFLILDKYAGGKN